MIGSSKNCFKKSVLDWLTQPGPGARGRLGGQHKRVPRLVHQGINEEQWDQRVSCQPTYLELTRSRGMRTA
eukprot:484140-Pelagomonas_calceolata.AAC.7